MKKGLRFLAYLPLFLFSFWIERNATLPYFPTELGWPWIFVDGSPKDILFWDMGLVLSFTAVTLLFFKMNILKKTPHWTRFLTLGLLGVLSMSLWQPTGVVVFQLIPNAILSSLISFFLFWGLAAYLVKTALSVPYATPSHSRFNPLNLLPLLFLATPFLGLDRLLWGAGSLFFILVYYLCSVLGSKNSGA